MDAVPQIEALLKAMEAGSYDAPPGTLTQGAARGMEDLSSTYHNTTFQAKHIKLQKELNVESCKAITAQFNRQLSYGRFGGSAAREGQIGRSQTSDWVRITYPMAFYSEIREVSIAASLVQTFDGTSNDESEAKSASIRMSGEIEFHLWRGQSDFSNVGVFDGNPFAIPDLPQIHGLDVQVRQSDGQTNAKDLMFAAYGSDESVVLQVGGPLTQDRVEDASLRSDLAFGDSKKLHLEPVTMANYNKITLGKERVVLGGSATDATGASLRRQFVSSGTVEIESTNFLRARHKPDPSGVDSPGAPTISLGVSGTTANVPVGTHFYFATTVNDLEFESAPSAASSQAVTAGQQVAVTITPASVAAAAYFRVYRGATASSARFIGAVKNAGAATQVFTDLGNKLPAFATGYLVDTSGMEIRELAPYTRLELPNVQLHKPEAFFRFLTFGVLEPRKQVILDNCSGAVN